MEGLDFDFGIDEKDFLLSDDDKLEFSMGDFSMVDAAKTRTSL